MAEQLFSGLIVAIALVLIVRLVLGESGRVRAASAWRNATRRFARPAAAPPRPLDPRDAARLADDAIRRARATSAVRTGNVIQPDAFRKGGGKGRKDRNLQ